MHDHQFHTVTVVCNFWRQAVWTRVCRIYFSFWISIVLTIAGGCDNVPSTNDFSRDNSTRQQSLLDSKTNSTKSYTEEALLGKRVEGEHVSSELTLDRTHAKAGDSFEVSVELKIDPLWEIHTLNAEPQATATRLDLTLPGELQALEPWHEPKPTSSASPDGHSVYVDRVVFTRSIKINNGAKAGTYPINCRVHYQACNERQCLRPEELELSGTLEIE